MNYVTITFKNIHNFKQLKCNTKETLNIKSFRIITFKIKYTNFTIKRLIQSITCPVHS